MVLLGDSITQNSFDSGGWGAQLAHWYVRKADVVNRGFSGCALHTHWTCQSDMQRSNQESGGLVYVCMQVIIAS